MAAGSPYLGTRVQAVRAMQALQNMRVNVYPGVTGPVQDAISAYVSGNLLAGNTAPAANYPGGNRITGTGNLNQQVIY